MPRIAKPEFERRTKTYFQDGFNPIKTEDANRVKTEVNTLKRTMTNDSELQQIFYKELGNKITKAETFENFINVLMRGHIADDLELQGVHQNYQDHMKKLVREKVSKLKLPDVHVPYDRSLDMMVQHVIRDYYPEVKIESDEDGIENYGKAIFDFYTFVTKQRFMKKD